MFETLWLMLLPVFGFLIGIVAAMTGIGGGVFIVPLLTAVYAFAPANAVGTSLTTIIFTASASTLNYARQRRIYYRTGLVLALATSPGAFLGAYLTSIVPANWLGLIFGVFLIIVALQMVIDFRTLKHGNIDEVESKLKSASRSNGELIMSRTIILRGAALSFFGGLTSGLLGIGGGILLVPIMALAIHMPIHIATATSMFTMIFTSISGVAQHYVANHIVWEYALPLALGTVLGAQVGAYASKKVSGGNLRRIFGIVLVAVSIQMILKYV